MVKKQRKKRSIWIIIGCLFVSSLAFFSLREPNLTIHLISESDLNPIDLKLEVDGVLIYDDSLSSGVYSRKTIQLDNFIPGSHEIRVHSEIGKASLKSNQYFLLNKTMIIEYYDQTSESENESPGFIVWYKLGKFLPD